MSHRIYSAVIERGVRTIDEFEGQPT
jgi:hypothetical protein